MFPGIRVLLNKKYLENERRQELFIPDEQNNSVALQTMWFLLLSTCAKTFTFKKLKNLGIWFVFGFDRNCEVCLENGHDKRTQYYDESKEFSLKKKRAN